MRLARVYQKLGTVAQLPHTIPKFFGGGYWDQSVLVSQKNNGWGHALLEVVHRGNFAVPILQFGIPKASGAIVVYGVKEYKGIRQAGY